MDPNANREEVLECARALRALLTADTEATKPEDAEAVVATGIRLTELVEEQDVWLRSGGFLPTAWTKDAENARRTEARPVPEMVQTHRTGGPCTALVTVTRNSRLVSVPCALSQGHYGACAPKEEHG